MIIGEFLMGKLAQPLQIFLCAQALLKSWNMLIGVFVQICTAIFLGDSRV